MPTRLYVVFVEDLMGVINDPDRILNNATFSEDFYNYTMLYKVRELK